MGTVKNIFDFNDAPRQHEVREMLEREDPARRFRQAMIDAGYSVPREIIEDSVRPERVDGPEDRPGKKSGWYVFYSDKIAAGAWGSWKTDETITWCAKAEREMSHQERADHHTRIQRAKAARDDELAKVNAEAKGKAQEVWEAAPEVLAHPYLAKKEVLAFGLRLHQGRLLIPMLDSSGIIQSYQTVAADGEKRFLSGGAKKGNFFIIPGEGKIAIAEGYATAASIHMATGWTVLVAFDAGNLRPVAEAWRKEHPSGEIVICGDNDASGVGQAKAKEAAEAVHGRVVCPQEEGEDWNDVHAREGVQAVKAEILQKQGRLSITEWGIENYAGPAPELQWLVKDMFPLRYSILVAAMGGAGKGLLMLDLALKVAGPRGSFTSPVTAFGHEIMTHGPVVIFSAEDDRDEIHRRVEALRQDVAYPIYIIPLPNAGGTIPLFKPGADGPKTTLEWEEIKRQLLDIQPVLVNFDPLASFALADINADPACGQFVQGQLAALGEETGATIVTCHHMAKPPGREGITSRTNARFSVRGTSAIVDGARGCYVIWDPGDASAREVCKLLNEPFEVNKIMLGSLAKANYPADQSVKTLLRDNRGLLQIVDDRLEHVARTSKPVQLDILEAAIKDAAARNKPFSYSGSGGVGENRHLLPTPLNKLSRDMVWGMAKQLIESKRVVQASAANGPRNRKWLDVPGGPFAEGYGEIIAGDFN
jgi:phage/plasmid primase-like uncharacterized protein